MQHRHIPIRNAKLFAEYKSGRLVADLSAEYGLTINTVFTIVQQMERQERKRAAAVEKKTYAPAAEFVANVRALAEDGKTREEIAATLGYSYAYVAQVSKRHGIKIARKPGTGMRYKRKAPLRRSPALLIAGDIVRKLREGARFTLSEIARANNVTREYAGQVFKQCQDTGLVPTDARPALAA